jgi:hypothetical protein
MHMKRTSLLILYCLLWSPPTFGDDAQPKIEASTVPGSFQELRLASKASANLAEAVMAGSSKESATITVSVAAPFDFSLLLTLLVGIGGLISTRRLVKSRTTFHQSKP